MFSTCLKSVQFVFLLDDAQKFQEQVRNVGAVVYPCAQKVNCRKNMVWVVFSTCQIVGIITIKTTSKVTSKKMDDLEKKSIK